MSFTSGTWKAIPRWPCGGGCSEPAARTLRLLVMSATLDAAPVAAYLWRNVESAAKGANILSMFDTRRIRQRRSKNWLLRR
jgi:hypothetical protein